MDEYNPTAEAGASEQEAPVIDKGRVDRMPLNAIEYALLAGLMAVVVVVTFSVLGEQVMGLFGRVSAALESTQQN